MSYTEQFGTIIGVKRVDRLSHSNPHSNRTRRGMALVTHGEMMNSLYRPKAMLTLNLSLLGMLVQARPSLKWGMVRLW